MNDRGERFDPAAAGGSSAPGPLTPNVFGRLARGSARHPWLVIAIYVALAAASLVVAAWTLDVDTNPSRMISGDAEFRQDFEDFSQAFPVLDSNFVVVVEGEDGEQARAAAREVAEAFEARDEAFISVNAPGTGEFFDAHGILYLDLQQVEEIAAQLEQALPTVQALADDPTLRGMARLVSDIRLGVEFERAPPEVAGLFEGAAETTESVTAGTPEPLDWTALGVGAPTIEQQRWYVLIRPALDYSALEPAQAALNAARDIVAEAQSRYGDELRVALTGEAVMNAEELLTVTEGAALAGAVSFVLVSLVIFVGFPAARLVVPAVVLLLVGILMTAGFAAVTVGYLNLISVAFAVLFIGLGVDYALHVILRYHEESTQIESVTDALTSSVHHMGWPLVAILLTTVLAFLAFTPTDFIGMAQLGIIASGGVVIAFLASMTLIPAVLSLFGRPVSGSAGLVSGKTLRSPAAERRLTLLRAASTGAVLVLAVVAVFMLPHVRFDGDPVNLKDPGSAAVVEFERILAEDPGQVYAAQVLSQPGEPAREHAAALEALPEVAQVTTVENFVPANQDDKIAALGGLRDQVAETVDFERPIEPAERQGAIDQLEEDLGAIAAFDGAPQEIAAAAERWREALAELDTDSPEVLARLEEAYFARLPAFIAQLRQIVTVEPVTLDNLDPDVRELYVAADGRWRLEVAPALDMNEEGSLEQFGRTVRAASPTASGAPVEIAGAAKVVASAMMFATAAACGLVILVLLVVFRRLLDVALVLAPLLLAGLLMLGYTVIAGSPFNFANVIVLPLLIGLGADSSIHYVMRAREEAGNHEIAETSTPRAVLLSALTTIASFGTLWLSSHRGVSSMGEH
ncbi:MAG: MMPL family transporter, partial [Hyphomicrobiales bacterium]